MLVRAGGHMLMKGDRPEDSEDGLIVTGPMVAFSVGGGEAPITFKQDQG